VINNHAVTVAYTNVLYVKCKVHCYVNMKTRMPSCRWQTRATRNHAKMLHFEVKTSSRQINNSFEV